MKKATESTRPDPSTDVISPLAAIDEFGTETGGLDERVEPRDKDRERGRVPALVPLGPKLVALSQAPTTPVQEASTPPAPAPAPDRKRWVVIALAALVALQSPLLVAWMLRSGILGTATGKLAVETDPTGIEVLVDGRSMGRSPLELTLPAGTRSLELRQGAMSRSLSVQVARGETVRHRFEFVAPVAAAANATGSLQVTTEPARAALLVDGVAQGLTPLTLPGLSPGEHVLVVRFPSGTVERRVDILAGGTASLHVVSPPPATGVAGWLSVDVASPLQIFEDGRLVGTTNIGRLLLPPGLHVLDFVSEELGFRTQRSVTVTPGAATAVRLELPTATLSVNAQPWAEVWIDGERAGETPLGNVTRSVGRHEIVLRHPELGERRQTVTMTTSGPNRVSVDMRRP